MVHTEVERKEKPRMFVPRLGRFDNYGISKQIIPKQIDDATLSWHELAATPRGRLALTCDVLILAGKKGDFPRCKYCNINSGPQYSRMNFPWFPGMIPFVLVDFVTIRLHQWGWPSLWHSLDLIIYVLQASGHRNRGTNQIHAAFF